MQWFFKGKDGGTESNVTGYWLVESKRFGSVVLLCFSKGSREAFHTHAFNALSWVLSGGLAEFVKGQWAVNTLGPSLKPIITKRDRFHQVHGIHDKTWVLSFRGPWDDKWKEYLPSEDKEITLTHGREIVKE